MKEVDLANDLKARKTALDMRSGIGIETAKVRESYAGQWRTNVQHGIGMHIQESGLIYSGSWKNGKRNGWGNFFYPNGEVLFAKFKNDQIASKNGIYILKDDSIVQGKMTMQGPTGNCIRILANGDVIEETWLNGKLNNK